MKDYTTRWRSDWFEGQDPVKIMNDAVNEAREDSVRMSLVLMENLGGAYNRYEDMATSGRGPARTIGNPFGDGMNVSGSLEDIHGTYHGLVGGELERENAGHMSSVPIAAFDPIFWVSLLRSSEYISCWNVESMALTIRSLLSLQRIVHLVIAKLKYHKAPQLR
jgi:Common central domain of tyrosinase